MKKKMMILMSVLVVTGSLFVNLLVTGQADSTKLVFENIEALAEKENGSQYQITCIDSGTVCIGINANNIIGRHPGLRSIGGK